MKIRGWIYVLSNKAMPGLLKVGYSTKDPILRVEELGGTGLPHPFVVEYDALVIEPRDIEQAVHRRLSTHHEAKEFFRTTADAVVAAIRTEVKASGSNIIVEQCNFVIGRSSTSQPQPGFCGVCGVPVTRNDTRCPKCFALLPEFRF